MCVSCVYMLYVRMYSMCGTDMAVCTCTIERGDVTVYEYGHGALNTGEFS